MPTLRVIIRDLPPTTCHPYDSSNATFYVIVCTCDWSWYDSFQCSEVGPGGGGIYGELEVPEGAYLVFAYGWPPYVETNTDWVQVGCDETACVNLVPLYWEQTAWRLQAATVAALGRDESAPQVAAQAVQREGQRLALDKVREAVFDLQRFLPRYEVADKAVAALQEARAPSGLVQVIAGAQRQQR